ncbi:MAG: DoxX family protein [Planctomycetota bacterium]
MAKIFLAPLRLATGWGLSPRLINGLAIAMLVILRLTIGWHFLSEGVDKYEAGDWSAKPFFANARGPMAGQFRAMVWDHDGAFRLDMERTKVHFAVYRDQIATHFGFDEAQIAMAQNNYAKAIESWQYVTELNCNEIEEFEIGLKRLDAMDRAPARSGVESLSGQRETVRRELTNTINPVFAQIDTVWDNYESAQNDLATDEQKSATPKFRLTKPRSALIDTSVLDRMVPYFDMTIGWLLILGLFTPLAALAAAAFLGQVVMSQYPPVTGPASSNYQLIECMACLVLASTGAGRFAGLDFFLHLITRKFAGRSAA